MVWPSNWNNHSTTRSSTGRATLSTRTTSETWLCRYNRTNLRTHTTRQRTYGFSSMDRWKHQTWLGASPITRSNSANPSNHNFHPVTPRSQHPTAASTTGTVASPPKQALKDKPSTPPDNRTSKQKQITQSNTTYTSQSNATEQTNTDQQDRINNNTSKHHLEHTLHHPRNAEPRQHKQSSTTNTHWKTPLLKKSIYQRKQTFLNSCRRTEEESPKHTSPEFEGPVEPVPAPKKKRRKQWDKWQ